MQTIIEGTVEFENEDTGRTMRRRVRFNASTEDAWIDIVDRAVEIATLQADFPKGEWLPTGTDTLTETEVV